MVTRLTALLLSFCIGLPMCWCCNGEAPREELAGCCSTEHLEGCSAQQPEGPPADPSESCPCCEHRKDPRDTSKRVLFSPKPEAAPVFHLAGWQDGLPFIRNDFSISADTPRRERGPPAEPPRLFLRHRALLL
jgi:hypothetical protein